jgi:SAM-dependent methyltransferase
MFSSKPTGYYSLERTDLVAQLPKPLGRVLDIGCGAGLTGKLLKSEQAERLIGVEINADAAAQAREIYDEVFAGPAEEVLEDLSGSFDTILCYDVLEHLVDPWRVLCEVSRLSPPGGRLHISVPNARHLSLVIDLVFHGTFNYQPWGHRDDTHLRWFTPRDLESAIERVGFDIRFRSHPPISPSRRLLGAVTGGKSTEFLVWQWQVLATRRPRASR